MKMNNSQLTREKSVFSSIKSRNIAGIFMAFVTATIMIPGMTTYLPFSTADQIAVPILLFPVIWLGLCMYAYMSNKTWHPWLLMVALTLSHAALSFVALTGGQ